MRRVGANDFQNRLYCSNCVRHKKIQTILCFVRFHCVYIRPDFNDNYIILTKYTVVEVLKYGLLFFSLSKLLKSWIFSHYNEVASKTFWFAWPPQTIFQLCGWFLGIDEWSFQSFDKIASLPIQIPAAVLVIGFHPNKLNCALLFVFR